MGRILIVDDDPDFCELVTKDLEDRGWDSAYATEAREVLEMPLDLGIDVVLTDLRMPGSIDGIELCRRIVESRPDVPVVVMTAFGSFESAVAAIRAGAYDFVTKPIETDVLQLTLDRALHHRELVQQLRLLTDAVERTRSFDQLIGESRPMQRLFDMIARVAPSEVSALVVGESGSGKEFVARALHAKGPRKTGPFVPVNCAAIPETLFESELFGHTKGAFTDARSARKGLIEEADGGTLFLDEVAEIPLALQPKLLRALEEGRVRPVGSNEERPVDVRLVCATNRDLEGAIEEGRFREDLYFRINVIQVDVPPLRGRGPDILLLAQTFLQGFAQRQGKPVTGLSRAAAEKLLAYSWPGNVRELRNCIERAVALTQLEEVGVDDLTDKIRSARSTDLIVAGNDPGELVTIEVLEDRYIGHVLGAVGGHRARAAKILGIDRKTLYRKLSKTGARTE